MPLQLDDIDQAVHRVNELQTAIPVLTTLDGECVAIKSLGLDIAAALQREEVREKYLSLGDADVLWTMRELTQLDRFSQRALRLVDLSTSRHRRGERNQIRGEPIVGGRQR